MAQPIYGFVPPGLQGTLGQTNPAAPTVRKPTRNTSSYTFNTAAQDPQEAEPFAAWSDFTRAYSVIVPNTLNRAVQLATMMRQTVAIRRS